MFTAKGLGPAIDQMIRTLIEINDGFLEPLRMALVEKKIKTWQEAVAMFENGNEVNCQESFALNTHGDR